MVRNGPLLAMALLFAGCAGLRVPQLPASEPAEPQVIQLLDYAQRIATMTPEQQRREYGASNQAFARDKDATSRMRLALLLATPGASVRDVPRAASLLEPMASSSDAANPLRSLARLLYGQLNERMNERMSERLGEQKRADQMREQIEAQKEVERTLRQQIEALKDVERTIMERGQESQPRRR